MANENAPIGQINPANLIGQFKPQTDATSNFVQAMRAGVMTANDIVQGIDRHQQSKVQLSAQQLALAQASDPNAMALQQEQVKLGLAQTRGALALDPMAQKAKEWQLKGIVWGSKMQQLGVSADVLNNLSAEGFPIDMNFDRDPTPGDAAKIKEYSSMSAEFHSAKSRLAKVEAAAQKPESFTDPTTKNVTQIRMWDGRPLDDATYSEAQRFNSFQKVGDWMKSGTPRPAILFPGSAGAVGVPAASPTIVPTNPPAAVAPAGTGTVIAPPAAPNVVPTAGPQVVPKGTAPVQATEPQVIFNSSGMTIKFPETRRLVKTTESERQTGSALTRMVTGEGNLEDLEAKGFDPAGYSAWLQGKLPNWAGRLKTENVRRYNQAASNWVQGLLRLESGAAIAYKEQTWYVDTFFPQAGDTQAVVAQKREARNNMMGFLKESVGNLLDPAVQAQYERIREQSDILVSTSRTFQGGQAHPGTPTTSRQAPIVSGGMQFILNPQTGKYRAVPAGQ